jgi:hypothetical protein
MTKTDIYNNMLYYYVDSRIVDFSAIIDEADKADIVDDSGFYVWGNAVIKHSDGLYYSFINKWDDTDGFDGWVHYNRIYVSNGSSDPKGVFTGYTELTALRGQAWCADMVTNQKVIRHNGTYYMFFVGTNYSSATYPVIDSDARANQRIGLATATHPQGPWALEATNPILEPRAGEWDATIVNNPSVWMDTNGKWRMAYKSDYFSDLGNLRVGVATSDDLITWGGRTDEPNFNLSGQAEDPDVWREGQNWYAVAKAFDNSIVDFGDGLFLTSKDGINFAVSGNQPA